MPAIKPISEIAEKWTRVTPARSEDYKSGIESPKKDWATETKAAETAYKSGVTKAAAEGRFGKGVAAAGTEKWKKKALDVGVDRWGPGVSIAGPSYEKGFSPYRDVIERTTLPPKGAKGDPRNYERVKAIGEALHKAKLGK